MIIWFAKFVKNQPNRKLAGRRIMSRNEHRNMVRDVISTGNASVDERKEQKKESILISLKEKYVEQILSGEKGYEYRKSFKNCPVTAYIYVTAPVKQIKVVVDFGKPIFAGLDVIGDIIKKDQPDAYEEAMSYLRGYDGKKTKGIALPILSYKEFKPISLFEMKKMFGNDFQPSPTWVELNDYPDIIDFLENHVKNKTISPITENKTIPPIKETKTIPPIKETKTIPPIKETKTIPPIKETITIPPIKETITIPPIKETKTISSIKETKTISPIKETETISPIKETKTISPIKETKTISPINEKIEDSSSKKRSRDEISEAQKDLQEDVSSKQKRQKTLLSPEKK